MKSIGIASLAGLLFLAVGAGLTAKPLKAYNTCADGAMPSGGYCYSYYEYETTYDYYEVIPEPKLGAE